MRILMTLFSDVIDENQFREQRAILKQLDSKQRHINVAINNAKDQLTSLLSYEKDAATNEESEEAEICQMDHSEIDDAMKQLSEIYKQRLQLNKDRREATKKMSSITSEVEKLEDELSAARESFLLSNIAGFEKHEARMAMHKLLFLKLCPACGNKASTLSQNAEMLASKNCCPLCGSDERLHADVDMPQLDAELTEKISQQLDIEKRVLKIEAMLDNVNRQESILQLIIDKIRIANPIISSAYTPPQREKNELKKELKNLENQYIEINGRFNKLQDELDSKYNTFREAATLRLKRLRQIYKEYATSFLGTQCDLEEAAASDRFLNLNLFVPRFDEKTRPRPETCSEAQRFFLDIAFRLALIDLTAQLSKSAASFICETPENSLDISYIENVATMFKTFAGKGHVILLTTNIQPGGLAKPILRERGVREKRKSILNLLEYGHLSDVQQKNIEKLNDEFKAIITGM